MKPTHKGRNVYQQNLEGYIGRRDEITPLLEKGMLTFSRACKTTLNQSDWILGQFGE